MPVRNIMPVRFILVICITVLVAAANVSNDGAASITFQSRPDADPVPVPAFASGLSTNKIISSTILGYDLQYRVFVPEITPGNTPGNTPEITPENTRLPVLYVTDGQWYIGQGDLPGRMNSMIQNGEISPVIAVFVDNRDPHNLSDNLRNSQFFGNDEYVRFFRDELVPAVEAEYHVGLHREDRVMLGLSFGGLNSACFGLMAGDTFRGIAMQSPAMNPVRTIHRAYRDSMNLDLKIFLNSGTVNDNEEATRRLRDILEDKNYEMSYVEVPYGHSWENWKPLLDDVLIYYYGADANSD